MAKLSISADQEEELVLNAEDGGNTEKDWELWLIGRFLMDSQIKFNALMKHCLACLETRKRSKHQRNKQRSIPIFSPSGHKENN